MDTSEKTVTNETVEKTTSGRKKPQTFVPNGPVNHDDVVNKAGAICSPHWDTKSWRFYVTGTNFIDSKVFRAFVVVTATLCTAYVCILSSQRYFNSWVQTVIDRTDVHISEIPFPAVTICPLKPIKLLRIQAAKEKFLGPNGTATVGDSEFERLVRVLYEIMWTNSSTAEQPLDHSLTSKVIGNSQLLFGPELDTVDLNALVQSMAYECKDLFAECTWLHTKVPCCTIFRTIGTYKGVCYSFNSVLVDDPHPHWPWSINVAGLNHGLKVALNKQILPEGFEPIAAMVHDPGETFSSNLDYLDGDRVTFRVSPLRFTADPDIHTLKPDKRRCYITSEMEAMGRTKNECLRDCRLKYIVHKCNCTLYPTHQAASDELRLCRPSDLICIYEHRSVLLTTGNYMEEKETNGEFNIIDCKCYPNCNFIQYTSSIHADTVTTQSGNQYDIHVYYQQETLFSYRSVLRFTLLDLIVSYGGIAGLFLGFSLVGIIKTLQQCVLHWKKRSKEREGSTEADKEDLSK